MTPQAALTALMEGNARFLTRALRSVHEDLTALKKATAARQEPFASVLACADSRVPVELIFDQTLGCIFVTRIAGNVVTEEIIASLEFGAAILGTPIIMVLAHTGCGAVDAAMKALPAPGRITSLYRLIQPAIDRAHGNAAEAEKANALLQADLLLASPVIGGLVAQEKLAVVAGCYDLLTGKVTLLDQPPHPSRAKSL